MSVGLATLVAPFFIMQPAMDLGLVASKAPRPNAARLKSIASHTVYGVGLYGSAMLSALLVQPIGMGERAGATALDRMKEGTL